MAEKVDHEAVRERRTNVASLAVATSSSRLGIITRKMNSKNPKFVSSGLSNHFDGQKRPPHLSYLRDFSIPGHAQPAGFKNRDFKTLNFSPYRATRSSVPISGVSAIGLLVDNQHPSPFHNLQKVLLFLLAELSICVPGSWMGAWTEMSFFRWTDGSIALQTDVFLGHRENRGLLDAP